MNDAPEVLAIIGATIIDGNGGPPIKDGVIIIEGRKIIAIGDRSTQIPPHAKQIVMTGKFVIPGLMDAFIYIMNGTWTNVLIRYEGRYDELAIEAAQIALKNGVTTVFDAWGPRDDLIKARNAINQGECIGSRIYLCGNWIGVDGPYSADMRRDQRVAIYASFADRINSRWQANVGQRLISMSPEQVRHEIREYVQSGVDYLSYVVSDHHVCEGLGALRYIVFSPRVQRVIVEEAHRAGRPVCGFHPATGEAVHLALEAGVDVIVHPSGLDRPLPEELVRRLSQRQVPCVILTRTKKALEHYRGKTNNSAVLKSYELEELDCPALFGAGVAALLGTGGEVVPPDSDFWQWHPRQGASNVLGDGHFVWLQAMQEKGMKPMSALMAATRNVAGAFKLDKELGTLERGKLADLLILDRNPLEKAENYRSISLVMKDGQVIDRDALPTQRLLSADHTC